MTENKARARKILGGHRRTATFEFANQAAQLAIDVCSSLNSRRSESWSIDEQLEFIEDAADDAAVEWSSKRADYMGWDHTQRIEYADLMKETIHRLVQLMMLPYE